ncbi:cytochrome c oxidase assembly protein [Sphingobium lactosutens]|uniref:Membrane protein n=1 Tax=Sphingobium lactosutens DS20 TaxID=1331060 RepID=T0H9C5_9SPHN|nr:cytochrome c oxidase assembly protein [Sphingobium lactosutens]EQB12906.1 membrane protein [Sphingobium lactosutens DS20]
MKRVALVAGLAMLPMGWLLAALPLGMIGHMAGHMIAVAVAAPLLAFGLTGTVADPARRWPHRVTPMAMMLVELVVVWLWHLPALRTATQSFPVLVVEQFCFLSAGLLLWSSVCHAPQRVAGIGALLLTSMHMTLLGVLIGLAPRPLYPMVHHSHAGLDPLVDQQLGGVIMLMLGAASYFFGGLALLASLLRQRSMA